VDFRILGALEVEDRGESLPLGGHQQRALLALLLLRANEVVPVDEIIDDLWGAEPPPSATKSVHALISKLRRRLENEPAGPGVEAGENGVLLTHPHGYVLTVASGELDLHRFQSLLDEGQQALSAGRADDAAAKLRQGLALWRGPPLAEFAYDPFAQVEIGRLEELRLSALEERIEADLALGRHRELVAELETLVAKYPYRERLRGQLMLALYRSGRQAEALHAYQRTRHTLVDALGIEPGQALRRLEQTILQQDESLDLTEEAAPKAEVATREPPVQTLRTPERRRMYVGFALIGVLVAAVAIPVFALRQGSGGSAAVEANSVAIIDPDSNRVVDSVSVGSGSEPTRVVGAGGSIWVLNAGVSTLSKIDPGTARVTHQIPLGTLHPFSLAASRSGAWVLGTTEVLSSSIIRVDLAYDKRAARRDLGKFIPTGFAGGSSGPGAVAVRAGALWVGGPSGDLYRLDPETLAIERRLETEGVVRALAVGRDAVWAVVGRSVVVRIDPRAPSVERFVVGLGAVAIAVDDQAVWVAAAESDALSRIDLATGTVTGVPVGDDPRDVTVAFGSVWVTNSNDGTVSRIDPETRKIVVTIPVGVRVDGIASAGGKLWVTGKSPL
jgi:YVTN family beta-propeller protein